MTVCIRAFVEECENVSKTTFICATPRRFEQVRANGKYRVCLCEKKLFEILKNESFRKTRVCDFKGKKKTYKKKGCYAKIKPQNGLKQVLDQNKGTDGKRHKIAYRPPNGVK